MQQIDLRLIAGSPNPIRKTWDEEQMNQLAESIKAQGVIVPIKVRPNASGYEIVYGHRRAEAARRAGLEIIPAIVDDLSDEEDLWQALTENLAREDMSVYDKGEQVDKLYRLGHTLVKQASKLGVNTDNLGMWRTYFLERQSGVVVQVITGEYESKISSVPTEFVAQVIEVKRSLGDDIEAKQAVLDKAARERLDWRDTRAVADAYKLADTPELKEAVLKTTGKVGNPFRILSNARQELGVESAQDRAEDNRRKAFEEYDRAVKDFLDWAKLSAKMLKAAQDAVRYGRFSPEGAQYATREIDKLIDQLNAVKEQLQGVSQ